MRGTEAPPLIFQRCGGLRRYRFPGAMAFNAACLLGGFNKKSNLRCVSLGLHVRQPRTIREGVGGEGSGIDLVRMMLARGSS